MILLHRRFFAFCFLLLACGSNLAAQGAEWLRANYTKHEEMVPMRDGVRLFTAIYAPKDRGRSYPFLLVRTPYSVSPYGVDQYRNSLGPSERYAREGYIFVYQDVRGRFQSEGKWVEMTPHRAVKRGPADVDESSDTFDTLEWLLKNVPGNNGKAGLTGVSYPGFYAAAGMIDAHPALTAVSPQAPIVDLFRGDDAFHNGAFFLAANFGFYTFFNEHKEPQKPKPGARFEYGTPDGYEFFLKLGPLSNANEKYFRFQNPYWTALTEHTAFDAFWQSRNLEPHVKNIRPALLTVGGWYDAEDLQGPLRLWRAATANGPALRPTLVMGPWVHGGWSRGDGSSLGKVRFDTKTAAWYRDEVEFPFFEHHLRGKPDPRLPAALLFNTGRNEWRRFERWPTPEAQSRTLYFQAGGALAFEKPAENGAFDEYVSDPAKPVPFTSFVTNGMAQVYMVDDQRHASARPDVLTYVTAPLEQDLTVGGPLKAQLHVSTSGTDSDWIVKLIDVYPDDAPENLGGFQQLVRGEPFRGRFWKGFEQATPLPSGKFVEIGFELPDILHTFRRGHRIMVQIQSSWFPLVDRNPQTFVPNIPQARPEDFRKATQRVSRSAALPSSLTVLVLPD
jgi:putative CocE/NonD family hydrolase